MATASHGRVAIPWQELQIRKNARLAARRCPSARHDHHRREAVMATRARKDVDTQGQPNPPPDTFEPSLAVADPDTEAPAGDDANDEIGDELRHRMISEAAYHLHAGRGYVDGLELDDWLQAEAEVDRMLSGRRPAH